jgi:hypothetical protein
MRAFGASVENEFVFGIKGQGKSHLQRELMRKFKGRILAFDHKQEFAHFFGGHSCRTFAEATNALHTRGGSLFWPGEFTTLEKLRGHFKTWCEWAWGECKRIRGPKLLVWDESGAVLDSNATNYEKHPHFKLMFDGRSYQVNTLGTAHSPADTPPDCRNHASKVYVFRLQSAQVAAYLTKDFGIDAARVQSLPKGEYIVWKNGEVSAGKVVFGK